MQKAYYHVERSPATRPAFISMKCSVDEGLLSQGGQEAHCGCNCMKIILKYSAASPLHLSVQVQAPENGNISVELISFSPAESVEFVRWVGPSRLDGHNGPGNQIVKLSKFHRSRTGPMCLLLTGGRLVAVGPGRWACHTVSWIRKHSLLGVWGSVAKLRVCRMRSSGKTWHHCT